MDRDLVRHGGSYIVVIDYSDDTVSYAKLSANDMDLPMEKILGRYGKKVDDCSWIFLDDRPVVRSLDKLYAWRKIRTYDDAVRKAKEWLTDTQISRMSPYGVARAAIDGEAELSFTDGKWYTPSLKISEAVDDSIGEYLGTMEMGNKKLRVYGGLVVETLKMPLNWAVGTWNPGNGFNRWAVSSEAKARHLSRWFYEEILDEMFPGVKKVWLWKKGKGGKEHEANDRD